MILLGSISVSSDASTIGRRMNATTSNRSE